MLGKLQAGIGRSRLKRRLQWDADTKSDLIVANGLTHAPGSDTRLRSLLNALHCCAHGLDSGCAHSYVSGVPR